MIQLLSTSTPNQVEQNHSYHRIQLSCVYIYIHAIYRLLTLMDGYTMRYATPFSYTYITLYYNRAGKYGTLQDSNIMFLIFCFVPIKFCADR